MLKKTTLDLTDVGGMTGSCIAVAGTTLDTPLGEFNVSANVTLGSEYIFRGISQTKGDPGIQGGLDIVHESGLYVGAWVSNTDYQTSDATMERDYYFGYGGNITEELALHVGWLQYHYVKEHLHHADLNYNEFYGSLSGYGFPGPHLLFPTTGNRGPPTGGYSLPPATKSDPPLPDPVLAPAAFAQSPTSLD